MAMYARAIRQRFLRQLMYVFPSCAKRPDYVSYAFGKYTGLSYCRYSNVGSS